MIVAFEIYDVDRDGFISKDDLRAVIKLMVGKHLSDSQIQHIVETTMREANVSEKDGKIALEQFLGVRRCSVQLK